MNIRPSDLVLEVGSGNNPNPRSNILVDRYIFDNGQRAGGFRIVIDRPIICADGYRLSFKDKSFDYVICSHILEHMEDPKKFIAEIVRVGKAGYIEVPSDISERIFGWNFHLWYCSFNGKTLTLRKKTEGERFGGFFHRLIADQIWFRRFFEEQEEKFYVTYEWSQQVKLRIDRVVPTTKKLASLDKEAWLLLARAHPDFFRDVVFYCSWMMRRIKRKAIKITRNFFWQIKVLLHKDSIVDFLIPLLLCPSCLSGTIVRQKRTMVCKQCGNVFPLTGVVPVMLTPAEQKKGY